ncbi:sugar transferase [Thermophagus sp. OGC60D27]|uniref:sugar transferase n=1 Tax=Thermophagus sp. OGC60D27 TaxID=3458415 RepID=UPI004038344B
MSKLSKAMKNTGLLSQVVEELSASGQYVLTPPLVRPIVDRKKEIMLKNISIEVYQFFINHLVPERQNVSLIDTNNIGEIRKQIKENTRSIINLNRLNHVRYINKFLIEINASMPDAGIFIGCVEPVKEVKEKYRRKIKNPVLFSMFWMLVFVFHRIMPKVEYLQKIYFFLTKGKYRYLTMGETLGRIASCGFEIIEYKKINGLLYFAVIKTKEPVYGVQPSFGPLFPMNRIGKNGKMIKVYKLRTMHPFAEFLQDYVTKLNGYNKVGKPANDFRVASWGKIYRKYWLDELPQLINVLKGELNIVGVRPLSRTRFNELPEDLQKLRVRFKPGCIPPYVALLMPDAEGNIEAERIYLSEKLKHPVRTDIKYFFMAIYNILSGKIKSS